jgi:hypothetical protein
VLWRYTSFVNYTKTTKMMKPTKKINLQEVKQYLDDNPPIKTAVYIGLGVVGLYVAGKVFSALASSVRGFNEFRSALKGN